MRIVVLRAGEGEVTDFVGDELVSVSLMAVAQQGGDDLCRVFLSYAIG